MIYSFEEAYNAALEYFKGDELAAKVWVAKYALKDSEGNIYEKTPVDMHWRLANEIARIEGKYPNPLHARQLFDLFDRFKYIIPQGSPMTGIGNNLQTSSISNCFVIGLDGSPDSYGGIIRIDEEQIQLMKRRGGVGHDLSHIRPKGSDVKNSALTSTGIVPFMERYSNSTREVAQDGRRGALMLSVSINHPDAEDFIDAKMEQGKVTGANISVKLDDDFMQAVVDSLPYTQYYPIYDVNSKISKQIDPSKLWKKIVHNAWKSAEPGVLFWDKVLRESIPDCYADLGFATVSTNPCFSGDTLVAVADGRNAVSIKDLAESGSEFPVYSARTSKSSNKLNGWVTEIKRAVAFKSGTKKTIVLHLSDGSTVECTPDHRIALPNGEYMEAQHCLGRQIERFYSFSSKKTGKTYRHINSKTNGYSKQYRMIWEFENGAYDTDVYDIHHIDEQADNDTASNLTIITKEEHSKLRSINPISRTDKQVLSLIQQRKSIQANAVKHKWSENKLSKALSDWDTINSGALAKAKQEAEDNLDQDVYMGADVFVDSISGGGVVDVYDLTVQDNHNFYIITKTDDDKFLNSSGILVHNCGEIPLTPYDSCRLLAINLYSYVVNPFTESAYFDWNLFKDHVAIAQRIMDDIVDIEIEKIQAIIAKIEADPETDEVKAPEKHLWEKILHKTSQGRRTGLGITAEGDMLAALGLRYGTEEASDFAELVHQSLAISAFKSSVQMAKERGSFPIFEMAREIDNPFLNRLFDADNGLYNMMEKHGRRNIACLTVAPTGTTSLMTQSTSGIEPVFMPVYKRRRRLTDSGEDSKITPDYIDENGDKWEEYLVFHHKFEIWMGINGYRTDIKYSNEELEEMVAKSPYYKATSNDVDWLEKVRMQGRVQKWVDHSISVTINLPADVPEELVHNLYIEAWRSGCKGCTVYRDGSRGGVLISATEKKTEVQQPLTGKNRPKELKASVLRFSNNKEKWIAFIGTIDGKPYEIFTGLNDEEEGIVLPSTVKSGVIIRNIKDDGSRSYDFQYTNKRGHRTTVEGLNDQFNPEYWNYAKLISGVLRYGMPIDQVVKLVQGLDLDNATINTWKNGVERALKKYIPNGAATGQYCSNCGQESLHYQEGCLTCTNCGESKCG